MNTWLSQNWLEIFGALTGVVYVFLEIRQNLWLWPVGILTSAVYIWVFFTGRLYADMTLQGYYLVISFAGLYWWVRGKDSNRSGDEAGDSYGSGNGSTDSNREILRVSRVSMKTGMVLAVVFIILFAGIWMVLDRLTDSPVPVLDSFITSVSVVATWMLARKIFEHWYLWIIANAVAVALFMSRGLYPTAVLYLVYCIMSFAGLNTWARSIRYGNDRQGLSDQTSNL